MYHLPLKHLHDFAPLRTNKTTRGRLYTHQRKRKLSTHAAKKQTPVYLYFVGETVVKLQWKNKHKFIFTL